jgi:ribosomal protein L11 methyltransferase
MPYRIDIACPPPDALDLLVELGALDVESGTTGLAAILPDAVTEDTVARALNVVSVTVSPAVARDSDSVWLLSSRAVRIGSLFIATPDIAAPPGALRLRDSNAFGTGHHPTTVLCIEALEEILAVERIASVLDVGTGSGILALAALRMGVPQSLGLDIDGDALRVAAENARLNHLAARLQLVHGGPDAVSGLWPLVLANVLAAPLIEMAPLIVRRVGHSGLLILSGIPSSVESEVRKAYEHLGMRQVGSRERGGWVMLMARASW